MEKHAGGSIMQHGGAGGGALPPHSRLCELDMQSYLEVMGRQLAEMQAQHHQFCASRPERSSRGALLRNQEHGFAQRAGSAGSGSVGTPRPLIDQAPSEGMHSPAHGGAQETPSSDSTGPGRHRAGARPASASARRSLVFSDSPLADSAASSPMESGSGRLRRHSAQPRVLHTSSSTPLPASVSSMDEGYSHAMDTEARPRSSGQAWGTDESPMPASRIPSVIPSSASFRANDSNTATPSFSTSTQLTAAQTPGGATSRADDRPGTASTSGRSPAGPYTVYDATGPAGTTLSTPETQDTDRPLMASVRSASQAAAMEAWRRSTPGAAAAGPTEQRRQAAAHGTDVRADMTPSTGSVVSPMAGDEYSSEEDEVPYDLTLAGQAFDGIDSEEDDEQDGGSVAGPGNQERGSAAVAASRGFDAAGDRPCTASILQGVASNREDPRRGFSCQDDQRQPSVSQARSAAVGSRPPSRAPLQAASLETEEALRALLASTHFPDTRAKVNASADAEGAEDIPDDVLAALARTDAPGLDALLGAATATIRENLAVKAQIRSGSSRTPSQGGAEAGAPQSASSARRGMSGPRGLTAEPAAVPASVAARGGETSARPTRTPMRQQAQQAAESAGADTSMDVEEDVDLLSRTLEVTAGASGLPNVGFRDSAASSVAAMAAQLAAAQAQAQPVLYSIGMLLPGGRAADGPAGLQGRSAEGESREEVVGPSPNGLPAPTQTGGTRPLTPEAPAASPSATPYMRGVAQSPSAASSRPGVDGDTVLFGSPGRIPNAVDQAAAPSVAASPYAPPSPPPGADPTPYTASPTVAYHGSRLQHNSRDADAAAFDSLELGAAAEAGPRSGTVGPLGVSLAAAGERALSGGGATGFNAASRRLFAKTRSSGATSSTASVSFDLSLSQAAAAAGGGVSRIPSMSGQLPHAASVSSSAAHLQQTQPPALAIPGEDACVQPVHSSFSVAAISPSTALSPSGWSATLDVSRDTDVAEAVRPASQPVPPGREDPPVSDIAGAVAPRPAEGQSSQPQQRPAELPLAAFSRAAALAAAADVGLKGPPVHAAAPRREPSARAASPPASAVAAQSASTAVHASSDGGTSGQGAAQLAASEDVHGRLDQPVQGQSPAPPSASSSAAKLIQLKARRQQQWQSQHGVHDHAGDRAATTPGVSPQRGGELRQPGIPPSHDRPPQPGGFRNRARATDTEGHDRYIGGAKEAATPAWDKSATAPGGAVGRHSLPAANAPSLLPGAVAEAIARAANGAAELAASGELSLGHGISGLSVAIEAGQLKWAWQTNARDTPTKTAASPSGDSNLSPWASPVAAQAAAASAASGEWAELPHPQWQQRQQQGQSPTVGPPPPVQDEHFQAPQPQHDSHLHNVQRRHSEYSLPSARAERQAAGAVPAVAQSAGPQQQYAVSAGGTPGGQESQQLRNAVSADVGGKASNKAAALMRLKRQSIRRHNALVGGSREHDSQQQAEEQQEPQHAAPLPPQPPAVPRQQPAPRAASAQRHAVQLEYQRVEPKARVHSAAARLAEPTGSAVSPQRFEPQRDEVDAGGGGAEAGEQAVQPKPFLRRRSAKVEAKKVDWSHVKPRTNTRNTDYYGEAGRPADRGLGSPRGRDAIPNKQRSSPLTSPLGGVAKPPLNVNNGARAWKPGGKLPQSPTEEEKAAKRRLSHIPQAPGYAAAYMAGREVPEENRAPARAGPTRGSGGSMSPLDDLLAHVNTLLRDFDKIVK